jgi:DNA-binding transcriptional LysR family regulator
MQKMDVRSLDLNLLKALQALLETQSITRMGEYLDISQPAASRVMSKLRQALGDPLLVRTTKGYQLTPHALSLAETTQQSLALAQSIFEPAQFDPQASTRCFKIASTDYGSLVVIPLLLKQFNPLPLLSVQISSWGESTLQDLEQGTLDIALYADSALPNDFHYRNLFTETYAVLLDKQHPLLKQSTEQLSLESLQAYPQIAATYPSGRHSRVDDILGRAGLSGHSIQATLPYFLAAPWLLQGTERLMILPKRAAIALSEHPAVTYKDLPHHPDLNFQYRMIWHARAHKDRSLVWLRQQILKMFENG